MTERILCVDDEPKVLEGYRRQFHRRFAIDIAAGGGAGLKALTEQGPFAVVVSDMRMPGMDGAEFLSRARALAPDTVRMLLTGHADQDAAIQAVNKGGIFRFLSKPCPAPEFAAAMEAGIAQYRLITAERQLLEETLNGSVSLLTDLLAMVDPESFEHAVAIRKDAKAVASTLGATSTWDIELAAMLSRIAYVTLPPGVLARVHAGEPLADSEQALLDQVPEIGARLIEHVPRLEPVAQAIRYQGKNFDGSGMPDEALAGEAIPLGARILRVVGDLHPLMASGAERKSTLEQMKRHTGCYDPKVLSAAARVSSELAEAQAAPVVIDVYLHRLQPGYRLVSPIEAKDGTLLLAGGKIVTRALLERLRNYARCARIREPIRVDISALDGQARDDGPDG